MFSRVNGVGWMEGEGEEGDSVSWNRDVDKADELSLSTFKSMFDDDWNGCYLNPSNPNPSSQDSSPHTAAFQMLKDIPFPPPNNPPSSQDTLLLQPVESSSSCSPSSIFALDPSRAPSFATPKNCLSSLLNVVCNNPFEAGFDLGCEAAMFPPLPASMQSNSALSMNRGGGVLPGFNGLGSNGQVSVNDFGQKGRFSAALLLPLQENSGFNLGIPSFDGFSGNLGNPLFANRPKVLRPLEVSPPVGAQPTLFQKRAALRQNSASAAAEKAGNSRVLRSEGIGVPIMPQVAVRREVEEEAEKQRKWNEKNEIDEASVDVSGLNYDSDEGAAETANKGEESGKNGAMGGDQKGKKKGLPAKNLMAERRRRKKLNDRLYMLRSVVPKISKVNSYNFYRLY